MKKSEYHQSVMVGEVVEILHIKTGSKVIDATLGSGGHSRALLEAGAEVLGIEMDPKMLEIAEKTLGVVSTPVRGWRLIRGNFRKIDEIVQANGFDRVEGVLFDLGVANPQLTSSVRGFSFANPQASLDLRIDPETQGVKGSDLLNSLRKDQLEELFATVMRRSSARWLAQRAVVARVNQPFKTVADFLAICQGLRAKPKLNPATLPFLALRIAVNSELDNLSEALPKAFSLLAIGGKILVITFHSQEEKVVLDFFKGQERRGLAKVSGPIRPTDEEIARNPGARSAELFVLERIQNEKN